MAKEGGFTLVELVAIIVLLGILAAVAFPRFVGRGVFDTRGYMDRILVSIQYARQQAIAQRRQVCVAITAGGLTITRAPLPPPGGVCDGTPLVDPSTQLAYAVVPPVDSNVVINGINATVLPFTLVFDPLGQPNAAIDLQIAGENNLCLRVEAVSGYVRRTC